MPSLRRLIALLSLLSLPVALVVLSGGTASARVAKTTSTVKTTSAVKSTPGRDPAALGRLQLGDLRAVVRWQDRLRYELHPVSELHRVGVHADARHLWRNQGRLRQLGNLGQLRGALEVVAVLKKRKGPREVVP